MMHFNPGDRVEILESGIWTGPFQVTDKVGRTPDHLVLASDSNLFELYNDYPFNVRLVSVPVRGAARGNTEEEPIHPENHLEPEPSVGVDMWCFTCDTWVDVENFTYSDIKDGALLQHVVDGIAHDPSIFRKF